MTHGFWKELEQPIIGLAPMDGVTDAAFRFITAKYGKPDVIITEFTAAEGIRASAERLLDDFYYSPIERPIVAQLFGSDPDAFYVASVVASALGFDGIDINMGCPAKNVTERGAGAALIKDPSRAKEIIRKTRQGNAAWVNGIELTSLGLSEGLISKIEQRRQELNLQGSPRVTLPVSVKTRIGVSEVVIEEWVQHLLEENPAVISVHGRTLKQLYSGLADWEAIAKAARIITQTDTLVLGNGDIQHKEHGRQQAAQYRLHGVLIGRAAFGNPWLFQEREGSLADRLAVALEHARYLNTVLEGRGFLRIRKHLLDYTKGFAGAKEMRMELMKVTTLNDIEQIITHSQKELLLVR